MFVHIIFAWAIRISMPYLLMYSVCYDREIGTTKMLCMLMYVLRRVLSSVHLIKQVNAKRLARNSLSTGFSAGVSTIALRGYSPKDKTLCVK